MFKTYTQKFITNIILEGGTYLQTGKIILERAEINT